MVDYSYYKMVYNGVHIEDNQEFDRHLLHARLTLNYYTLGRYKDVEDEDIKDMVKITLCQLADKFHAKVNAGNLVSESLDDMSYTYQIESEGDFNHSLSSIIRVNLSGTGLLYRGVSRR